MGSTSPYDLRWVEVIAVSNPTPRMRRVVFGGPALEGFTLKPGVLAPHVGIVVPSQDGSAPSPLRIYSVRRFDAAAGTLEVNFVLHGGAGVASRWAARAKPGERAGLTVTGGIPMKPADRYVVAGDHTALPAIAHLLEALPDSATADVFIEVPDEAERQALPSPAAATVTWFHRRGEASRLADAVLAATPAGTGGTAVWTGTEHRTAQRIRSHVRQTLRLPADACSVVAYWKACTVQGDFQHYD